MKLHLTSPLDGTPIVLETDAAKPLDPRALYDALMLGRGWLRAAMYANEKDLERDWRESLQGALKAKREQLAVIDAQLDALLWHLPEPAP